MIGKMSEEEREEMLARVEEQAASYQYEFHGCGRNVVLVLQEEFNLPGGVPVVKSASFIGMGIAHLNDLCGALIGGIMVLGLFSGPESLEDSIYPEIKVIDETTGNPRSVELVRGLYRKFVQEYGSSSCGDIQEKLFGRRYNLTLPEELKEFSRISRVTCAEMVGKVTRMTAETLLELPRR